jgi:hypothetical protein
MANSSLISSLKDKVIKTIINNDAIVTAIGATDCNAPSDLVNTHIFRYNKNPKTITTTMTFITVMVHTNKRDSNGTYITPTLEIWIYSHNDHMDLEENEIPGITDDRNDYISKLLDLQFNGQTIPGVYNQLILNSNTEGTYNDNFLYRRMIFTTIDVNNSFCGR